MSQPKSYTIERTQEEIEELIDQAVESVCNGQSKWPWLMYEQGIRDALFWLFGERDDYPMDD